MEDKKDYEESLRQMIEQYKKCKKEFDELKFGKELDEIKNIHKEFDEIGNIFKDMEYRLKDRINRLEEPLTNQEKQELAEKWWDVRQKLDEVSSASEIVSNYWSHVKEIQDFLSESEILKINDMGLKKELQKIRSIELPAEWNKYDHDEWREALSYDLLPYIDPLEFKQRGREIGTIIVGQSTPPIFSQYFIQIRWCYQCGLDDAVVVFCRALLEVGLRESLKKRGFHKTNERIIYLDECNLNGLMRECKEHKFLPPKSLDKLHAVRKEANRILHYSDRVTSHSRNTLSIVRDTFSILEEIYH